VSKKRKEEKGLLKNRFSEKRSVDFVLYLMICLGDLGASPLLTQEKERVGDKAGRSKSVLPESDVRKTVTTERGRAMGQISEA